MKKILIYEDELYPYYSACYEGDGIFTKEYPLENSVYREGIKEVTDEQYEYIVKQSEAFEKFQDFLEGLYA